MIVERRIEIRREDDAVSRRRLFLGSRPTPRYRSVVAKRDKS
jgi:hypothetical protein